MASANLTLVTPRTLQTGGAEFWLSDVVPTDEGDVGWSFSIYGEDKVFIVEFHYAEEAEARRAAVAIAVALKDAIYVGPKL